jgi:hypothetical protein
MRIAFIAYTGARTEGSWPSIARSMAEAFVRSGHTVHVVREPQIEGNLYWRAKQAGHKLTGTDFYPERERQVAEGFARQVEREINGNWPDLIFSSSSLPLAWLEAPCPTAFWTDATFACMTGFYKEFSRMSASTLRSGNALERAAMANVSHSFYASEWAAASAIRDHGADPGRVHVVPFGPNIPALPMRAQVMEWIAGRGRTRCDLLFIGYDWERKGGPVAVQVLRELRAMGVPAFLTVIGCEPPGQSHVPGLEVIGRLDKDDPPQRRAIEHALANSHFLPAAQQCGVFRSGPLRSLGVRCS